jgi:hypothetical protein
VAPLVDEIIAMIDQELEITKPLAAAARVSATHRTPPRGRE